MSNNVYSREYLRSVPEELKQKQIHQTINSFLHEILDIAATGKTSYMVNMTRVSKNLNSQSPKFTDEELVAAIQKRFPDCAIKYEEQWVETGRNTRVRKTDIVIDWS